MSFNLTSFILLFLCYSSYSQVDVRTKKLENDTIQLWKKTNKIGLDLTEVAYVNWSSGGSNSVSGLLNGAFTRKYKEQLLFWNNELFLTYGLNKQQERELQKTEDALVINSTFGFKKDSLSNFYYSAKLNFNTQFTNGYNYPNTESATSKFMAPGYLLTGIGMDYTNKPENFNLYLSPLTLKSTFVLDQELANRGVYGVKKAVYNEQGELIQQGEKTITEFGGLLSAKWEKDIYKNINLNNRIRLYTDYLNDFGNIDIDWELNFNLIVNEYVRATIGTHLKYDDQIKHFEDKNKDGELEKYGPKIQFKQLLGVGLVYDFS